MFKIDNYYEHYLPNVPAAVIASGIFAAFTVAHAWLFIRSRTRFCIPLIVGALFEVIGFVARAVGNKYPGNLVIFCVQSLGILLAPILFAATVYMFLGRIIRATGFTCFSMIRIKWLTKVFVIGDILCFGIQGHGGSTMATAKTMKMIDVGKYIILAGLLLQMFIFGFFLVVAVVFHRRMKKHGVDKVTIPWDWERFLKTLYIVSILITVRNLFRVIEYVMGKDGYLLAHEWPMYVFDAGLMVVVLTITSYWYVGDVTRFSRLPSEPKVELNDISRGVRDVHEEHSISAANVSRHTTMA